MEGDILLNLGNISVLNTNSTASKKALKRINNISIHFLSRRFNDFCVLLLINSIPKKLTLF